MIRYTDNASTKSEAEEKALALLIQCYHGAKKDLHFGTWNNRAPFGWTITLLPEDKEYESYEEAINNLPTVYISVRDKEKDEAEGNYHLYLCENIETLPFFARHIHAFPVFLPMVCPIQKPTEALSVEDVHRAEGRKLLYAWDAYGETSKKADKDLAVLRDAPKNMRIYAFFDNFGDMTLQEIKESLEAGEYEGSVTDGELLLSELTGETYETEEKYLSALSELCGAGVVKKYKKMILSSYRFYNIFYYLKYLEYTLTLTEDYNALAEQEPELAKRYGFLEEYLEEYLRGEYKKEATALDVALAEYLKPYSLYRFIYDGLTLGRIADYLNAPEEKLREVEYKDLENAML